MKYEIEIPDTAPFHCFYECHKCKRKHKGTEHTPVSCAMVPGTKPNEWVFECMPSCETYADPPV